jgi:hypothetical protein
MLNHVGVEVQDLQPAAFYGAADLQLPAPFVEALQPATLMEALDQGLDAERDAVAICGHRLCGAVSGVNVQVEIVTIKPANPRALGKPAPGRYAFLRAERRCCLRSRLRAAFSLRRNSRTFRSMFIVIPS